MFLEQTASEIHISLPYLLSYAHTCSYENCQALFLSGMVKLHIFSGLYIVKRLMVTFKFQLPLPSINEKKIHPSATYT
jgi:hypothetical protein